MEGDCRRVSTVTCERLGGFHAGLADAFPASSLQICERASSVSSQRGAKRTFSDTPTLAKCKQATSRRLVSLRCRDGRDVIYAKNLPRNSPTSCLSGIAYDLRQQNQRLRPSLHVLIARVRNTHRMCQNARGKRSGESRKEIDHLAARQSVKIRRGQFRIRSDAALGQWRWHVHKESTRNTGCPKAWSEMTNRKPVRDRPGALGWRRGSVPRKPGNAGGGKGPQFKTGAIRGEGPGDWEAYQLRKLFRSGRKRCTRKREVLSESRCGKSACLVR